MSIITWPGFGLSTFSWTPEEQQLPFKSLFGTQAMEIGSPLLSVQMTGMAMTWADANAPTLFIESLRGFRNQVALWNVTQPIPKGTMRGTMVLASPAAQGDTSMSISAGGGQAGKTLLAGDLIGIGSGITQQVVRIVSNAVANGSGVIEVDIGTPLRNDFTAGTAVEWNRPKALFRQREIGQPINFTQSIIQPWSLQFLEDWRP